jgi:hypothetical protein
MSKEINFNSKEKGLKRPYILLIIAVIIGLLTWQFYKYKIANKSISKVVSEKSKGLYSIHYDSLFIDELSGILHVKNIEIIPDTTVYNQLVKEKKNPSILLRISVPALDIIRIKTPKALLSKQIEGSKIEISNAKIEISINNFLKDSSAYNPAKDISKELLGKFLHIKIDSIQINHANLVVKNMQSNNIVCKTNNASFLFTGLLIDSTSGKDTARILFSKSVDVTCDEILLPSKNKDYHFHIEKLQFSSRNNSFEIGRVKIIPQLPEDEFARASPVQRDRYDFILEGIALQNISMKSLWQKKIEADSLIINKSSFKIFRDLSYPRDTLSRVGKYPQQMLMHVPVPFLIKKLIFINSFIEYKEKNAKSDSAGKVQFYNVHATMNNATNIHNEILKNNECTLLFNAKFLNKAAVNAKLVMLLKNPQGKFSIEGNIGAIDAIALNPLTQPMGLARIEKGNIKNVHFNFRGNDYSSEGKLVILYNDIKVSLLKKDKAENKYDKKVLPSLAADILMKKSNPGKNDKTRVADVHYKRDINKSFFNLLWKSIFTGIKETAGMK